MMDNKKAFIFPAFITAFTEKEIDFLGNNSLNINTYLEAISGTLNIDLPEFSYENSFFRRELNSQLLAYAMSCAITDALNAKNIVPDYVAGYSMGIYASLYAAKSIDYKTGAEIIFNAYQMVKESSKSEKYGMGAIIGLSYSDMEKIINDNNLDLEVINVNNEHSMVSAGLKDDILILLSKAKEEGAISTAELTVDTPYHSKFLLKTANSFSKFLERLQFDFPQVPIISTYNQREINTTEDVKSELVFNLTQRINWYKTMSKLIKLGVNEMYECGAGKDLKKISRFIQGNYKIKSIYRI